MEINQFHACGMVTGEYILHEGEVARGTAQGVNMIQPVTEWHNTAGRHTEPMVSVPWAPAQNLAATAAADPPLEPLGV